MEEQRIIWERKERYERKLQSEQAAIQSLLQSPPLNQYYQYQQQENEQEQEQEEYGNKNEEDQSSDDFSTILQNESISVPLPAPISSPSQKNSFAAITKVTQFLSLILSIILKYFL